MPENIQWILKNEIKVPSDFRESLGVASLVAHTLYQRGYRSVESAKAFLYPELYQPTPPEELPDIEIAFNFLGYAIKNRKRILVWGDFDVDGQTATTVLVQGLRSLGGNVIYHIPVRAKESHGITRNVLQSYLREGFDLLLTCDTGISEHDNVQFVRDAQLPVIITDHHTLPEKLPHADAIINPQRLPEDHPLRTLPGVGVAYKLIEGLHHYLGVDFDPGPYLELAALGIVADVAELRADTRNILQKGLNHLRHTQRVGLQTLYVNAELNPTHLNETHIGFQIGPRLNAIGRLADANPMVEFLTTKDKGRARVLGMEIEATNAKRRFASRQVEKAAESMLQNSPDDRLAPAIVLHHPDWPGGVIGPVASRLVERFQKPVLLFTGKDPIHGSGRSVEGINITEMIKTQAEHLANFGGHPMAAGLSMPASAFDAFKRGFMSEVEKAAKRVKYVPKIDVDRILHLEEITDELMDQIEKLAPFGAGFPVLKFLIENLTLVSYSDIGQNGEHRQVMVEDEKGNQQRIIWWNGGSEPLPQTQFDLVCSLSKSDYRGTLQINAEWIDFRLSEQGLKEIEQQQFEVEDYRQVLTPLAVLNRVLDENADTLVWAEGKTLEDSKGVFRTDLSKTENLVIWTIPPSQDVLEEALRSTKPRKILVFGEMPEIDHPKRFLNQLAGLVNYAINQKHGQASIERLAAACATETETIRIGLKVWEARGDLSIDLEGDEVFLRLDHSEGDGATESTYEMILAQLLSETQSYRRFFQTSDLNTILKFPYN